MSNLIFEIKNIENNFQIGIFENFEYKEDLLKLYESLIVSTEKEFDKILNENLEIDHNENYYVISNPVDNDLISLSLNKNDSAFVEQITKLTENLKPIEYLSLGIKKVRKEIITQTVQPTQLEILLGFKSAPSVLVSKSVTKPNKPGTFKTK
jgi:hypothetical protein